MSLKGFLKILNNLFSNEIRGAVASSTSASEHDNAEKSNKYTFNPTIEITLYFSALNTQ